MAGARPERPPGTEGPAAPPPQEKAVSQLGVRGPSLPAGLGVGRGWGGGSPHLHPGNGKQVAEMRVPRVEAPKLVPPPRLGPPSVGQRRAPSHRVPVPVAAAVRLGRGGPGSASSLALCPVPTGSRADCISGQKAQSGSAASAGPDALSCSPRPSPGCGPWVGWSFCWGLRATPSVLVWEPGQGHNPESRRWGPESRRMGPPSPGGGVPESRRWGPRDQADGTPKSRRWGPESRRMGSPSPGGWDPVTSPLNGAGSRLAALASPLSTARPCLEPCERL